MKKKGKGIITEIHNNYGIIQTDAFNRNGDKEDIPFLIPNEMIESSNGDSYIRYSKDVSFELHQTDGLRRQGRSFELKNITCDGVIEYFRREFPSENYVERTIDKFKKYNFRTDEIETLNNDEKYEYLVNIGFQPRMLNYLINGIFLDREMLSVLLKQNSIEFDIEDLQLDPRLIVAIDKIDQKFRSYLMEWVLQIEKAIKSFLSRMSTQDGINESVISTLELWKEKKGSKIFEKARKANNFRRDSDYFDYVASDLCPLDDFLDQLDLFDLKEFSSYWYANTKEDFNNEQLEKLNDSLRFFGELSVLRNASAHGRPVLPGFMDPDFNPNWDLEFDFTTSRTKVKQWKLYPILESFWQSQNVSAESIPSFIQLIFGNQMRRAWVTLNYLYKTLMPLLDMSATEIFFKQVEIFLDYPQYDIGNFEEMKKVNLLDLRLSDMGPTTMEILTGVPAPYKEIANEAFAILDSPILNDANHW